MDWLEQLDIAEIKKLHVKYMSLQSLNKTVEWIQKTYRVDGVNRHQLSLLFKRKNLEVLPPNGRSIGSWRIANQYRSPESELAANILTLAIKDVKRFMMTKGKMINFLSACQFFSSDMYGLVLELLNDNKYPIGHNMLPTGIDESIVRRGSSLYTDQYNYWVVGNE